MWKLGLIALAVFVAVMGVEAKEEVKSDVTIDSAVKVVPVRGEIFEITATGTISLAAGDTLKGYRFFFTDPAGKEHTPAFRPPLYPPKPGKTTTFSCVCDTSVQGAWTFWVEVSYEIGGKKLKKIPKSQPFDVPTK